MKTVVTGLAGLLVAVVCVRLGIWQLDRLDDRRTRNAEIEAQVSQPLLDLPQARWGDSLAFRRATASGVFDFDREVVLMARSRGGIPGVHIVTPLRLESGDAVLVERGFVPSPDSRSLDVTAVGEPGSALVTGVLLQVSDETVRVDDDVTWPLFQRRADPERLQPAYPYRLFPYLLRRTEAPANVPTRLSILALPERSDGPHLSYAIQWFSFATIAVIGTFVLLKTSRAEPKTRDG